MKDNHTLPEEIRQCTDREYKFIKIIYCIFLVIMGWGLGICFAKLKPDSMPFDNRAAWGTIIMLVILIITATFVIIQFKNTNGQR